MHAVAMVSGAYLTNTSVRRLSFMKFLEIKKLMFAGSRLYDNFCINGQRLNSYIITKYYLNSMRHKQESRCILKTDYNQCSHLMAQYVLRMQEKYNHLKYSYYNNIPSTPCHGSAVYIKFSTIVRYAIIILQLFTMSHWPQ